LDGKGMVGPITNNIAAAFLVQPEDHDLRTGYRIRGDVVAAGIFCHCEEDIFIRAGEGSSGSNAGMTMSGNSDNWWVS
jgi:hypothetical protein